MRFRSIVFAALLAPAAAAFAQGVPPALSWPRTLPAGADRIEVYQPQVETWQGDRIGGRAAIAVGPANGAPIFGVARFAARAEVNKAAGLVHLDELRITSVDIPTAPDRAPEIQSLLQSRLPPSGTDAALDQLQTTYAVGQEMAKVATVEVRNDVPDIIFSAAPAALAPIDGRPVLRPLAGTQYQRAINARPLVLRDAKGGWFVLAAGHWYAADRLDGSWSVLPHPPAGLTAAQAAAARAQPFDPMPAPQGAPPAPPALFVRTVPAELVQTQGPPQFVPVEGIALLEMRNADHAAFMDPSANRLYLLVSGRWFSAGDLAGPWSYVAPEALPAALAQIPPDDPKANALVSVPGTEPAREAAIAATIPQTATIERAKARLTVSYAGPPKFAPIPGTELLYAVNTATPVIQVGGAYYALSQGVWFTAATAAGPWRVAASVPPPVYAIPAASPLHYVTYVQVYRATPTTVVVGYMPGYMGVIVAPPGVVVYGTGYVYPPYVAGTVYYGYPQTYGYGAGFALGAATGFAFGYAAGYGASPYWGPYWHGGYTNWQNVEVNHTNFYGQWGSASVTHVSGFNGATSWQGNEVHGFNPYTGRGVNAQTASFTNPVTGTEGAGRRSTTYNQRTGATTAGRSGAVYNPNTGNYAAGRQGAGYNPTTGTAGAHSRTVTGNAQNGTRTVNSRGAVVNPRTDSAAAWHNGDIYAGHDGNVYRRQDGSWEKHGSDGWQPVQASGGTTGALDRQWQGRQLGESRAASGGYGGARWGGGGARGGGRFAR